MKEKRSRWIARMPGVYGSSRCVITIAEDHYSFRLSAHRSPIKQNKSICSYLAGCDQPYPAAAEPINLVSKNFPPTCIVAASADELIPPIHSHRLHDRLKELGVDVMRVECEGMNHGEAERSPISREWPEGNTWWEDALLPSLQFALERMTR